MKSVAPDGLNHFVTQIRSSSRLLLASPSGRPPSLCSVLRPWRFHQDDHNWITGGYTGECSDSWPKEHPIVMSAEQLSAHGTLTYASHGFKKSSQVTVASNERCYHEGLMKSRSMRTTSRSMRIASSLRTLQLLHLREVKVTGFEHRVYLYWAAARQRSICAPLRTMWVWVSSACCCCPRSI